jgi:hypothetical protein
MPRLKEPAVGRLRSTRDAADGGARGRIEYLVVSLGDPPLRSDVVGRGSNLLVHGVTDARDCPVSL